MFCRNPPKSPAFHSLPALREAFKALHDSTDVDVAFSRLDETDWVCHKQISAPQRVKRRREEEAAPPGSPPSFQKTSRGVTISRLVQGCEAACCCDLCASPEASPEPPGTPVAQPADPEIPPLPASPRFPRCGVGSVLVMLGSGRVLTIIRVGCVSWKLLASTLLLGSCWGGSSVNCGWGCPVVRNAVGVLVVPVEHLGTKAAQH